jgi:hypothetical protein
MLPLPRVKGIPGSRQRIVRDRQPSFAGGVNITATEGALRPDQVRTASNCRLTPYGAIVKRGGTQRTTAAVLAAAVVRGGYTWRNGSATTHMVLVNGDLMTAPTATSLPMVWTDRNGAFTASAIPSFAGFRDASANVCYIATGGAMQKWDGASLSTPANAVDPTGICVYHDRLWGWGVSGALDSVYYSNLSSATSSTGGDSLGYATDSGGQIIVRTYGQSDIVVCLPINTSLLILHKQGVSRLNGYGTSDIILAPEGVTPDYGCVGPQAACVFENVAYFVSEQGLIEANETSVRTTETPEKPDPTISILQGLSAANLALVQCRYNRLYREVWVWIPTSGVWAFNTVLRSWSGPYGVGTSDCCFFEGE